MGHSLGGYLVTCYALRYPSRVRHLVLVGAAGLGPRPPDNLPATTLKARFGRWGWDAGITPGVIMRCMGPLGPQFAGHYVHTRFDTESIGVRMGRKDKAAFGRYMYHIMAQRGSSEFALRLILAPGAWPRRPLLERAGALAVPISLVYGAHDWCDYRDGEKLAASMRARGIPATLARVPRAAHHVYVDAPQAFNSAVLRALRQHVASEDRRLLVDAEVAAGAALLELPMPAGFEPEDNK